MDLRAIEKSELLDYLLEEEGIQSPRPQVIARRENPDELPLSFAQQRLWFLNQLEPESACYNEPAAVRLAGPLDLAALEQGINEIARRHEVLRAVFTSVEGQPAQVVRESVTLTVPLVDIESVAKHEQNREIHKLALAEYQRPFDLAHGPLTRVRLLRLAPQEHVLLLTMHHSISDGWSVGVFFKELAALYGALCLGQPSPLAELPIQYADFAYWQRRWLQGEPLEEHLGYWKKQLGGSIPILELPSDRPRPPVQTFRGARLYFSLPASLSDSLKALSRRENVTLFMLLLAAFQTLLQRTTGQDDVLVGSPVAGRNWSEVEGLIGCFLNTIVLRTDLGGDPSFRELLGRARHVATEAYAHQDLPFEQLVEELHPERDTSRNPLFQVMFVLQNTLKVELPNLAVTPLKLDRGATPLDLILSLEETGEGVAGWWEYSTDLFDAASIVRMAGHFQTLLEGVVANPEQRLSELPLLTEAERQQLLVEWSDTRTDFAQDACLHRLFEAQVEKTPEAVAVVFEDEQLTYRELNRRANQLAHHLKKLGVEADVLVGLCVERSLEMVVAIFGVLKAGGAYVPLDPAYPKERLAFMIEDSQARVLLTQSRLLEQLPIQNPKSKIQNPTVVCLDTDWESIAAEDEKNPLSPVQAEKLAYVIYTSGSTGRPKGVMIPHSAICNHMFWMQREFPVGETDRVIQKTPFSFDASVWEFFAPLFAGAELIMARPGGHQDSSYLVKLIAEKKVTVLQLVPSLLQMLLEEKEIESCTRLKRVFCGGEALSRELVERFFEKLPVDLHNLYGPTEASIDSTFWSCARESKERSVPIGRPISNMQAYVLEPNLQPVPIGVAGELHIGGAGLARGYLNRPELTEEKFIPNPFSSMPGARLYKSGDMARYRPDGALEYLGRIDHQVKLRGFRIELGEIEAVLSQHPTVKKSVVLVREDSPGDPSAPLRTGQRLVAYIVGDHERPETSELRSFLKEKLPDYMVPSAFVFLDTLPLMPNGKVDRRALPAPDATRSELEKTYLAPRDALEFQLTQIWERVLGVNPIGVRDDFFGLGGHSLLAVRLLAQIEKMSGKKLPLVTLFQAPTVEQLADILRQENWQAPWSSLVAVQPSGSKLPFFCVHAAAGNVLFYSDLARHLGPDQPFYGLQAQGLDGDEMPSTRVEEMAALYIKEIRSLQAEGPYLLGGLSFGGVMAYEMAQQLQAQGLKVGLVVLFDTYGPGYPKISLPRLLRDKGRRAAQRIYNNARRLLGLGLREQAAFALEKAWNVRRRTKTRTKKKIQRIKEGILTMVCNFYVKTGRPLPPSLRYLRVREADHEAHREYVPKPYSGRVALLRANRQPLGCYPDPKLGWGSLVNGELEIYEIPGSHSHTLIREPHVRVVVEKLNPCLSRATA